MLRVWKISGEELVAIEKKDMWNDDIHTLKTLLRSMYGFPVHTQTLVLDGCSLEPHCRVRFPSDLQLILTPLSDELSKSAKVAEELVSSAGQGQLQTLRLLIEARADKDLRQSYYGRTALIYSASQGQVEVVRFLLECRANLNAADNQMRNTALEHASARGHAEVTRLLLEAGARSRKEFGLACSQGHVEVVEKLLVAGRPVDSDAGLIHAASESRETVARLLLKAGADVDIEDDYCRTALMHAARGGDFAMFSLLLEASADACVIDSGGDTALISASTHGHVEIVRRLLETKADTEALGPCVDSITALMGACENGHLETARLLLEAGADKDKLDRLGGTAITRASERGHVDI
ncbi:mask, partial [Symbiodinium sp. CCMP2456]